MKNMKKFKPAVTNTDLLFLAGLVWACVGTMLLLLAFSWLSAASRTSLLLFGGSGVVCALMVPHFGCLKIVDKNLDRILPMDEKQCLFAFIPWKRYLIIAFMITMGAILRHSSIPKPYLAILYTTIGLALILSSVRYIRTFFQIKKSKECLS